MADTLKIVQTVEEAAACKSSDAVYLAGGTEINRLGSTIQADALISIKRIDALKKICTCDAYLHIGSGCTFTEILEAEEVPEYLKAACRFMASRTKRNMATIGGNVAALRSDSYLVPTLIAARARMVLLEPGEVKRTICMETYLEEKEDYEDALILEILIPIAKRQVFSKRYANTAESHAVLTVSMGKKEGEPADLTIACAIKNSGIYDLSDLAVLLEADSKITEEDLIQWAYSCERIKVQDDMFGSEKYKRYLLGVTVSKLYEELKKGGE